MCKILIFRINCTAVNLFHLFIISYFAVFCQNLLDFNWFWFIDSISNCSCNFSLRFTHTNCNLDQSIRNSFVVTQLHQFWSHWNTKLGCQLLNLFLNGFGRESWGHSFEALLGVHKTLQLRGRIITLHLESFLLLGSLGVSGGHSVVKLSLKLCCLQFSSCNWVVILISQLELSSVRWVFLSVLNRVDWLGIW